MTVTIPSGTPNFPRICNLPEHVSVDGVECLDKVNVQDVGFVPSEFQLLQDSLDAKSPVCAATAGGESTLFWEPDHLCQILVKSLLDNSAENL